MRVVFFGTPEFAVPSLNALVGEGFDVAAVVTQPDRPTGRSRSSLTPPPVKIAALAEEIPVLQPERPSGAEFYRRITDLAPEFGVVVAYGELLKPELLAIPRRGMLNVHPSLLPELRGAAPIEWAIINGLEKTGVTIMQLDAGLDTGPIIHQLPHALHPDETAGELGAHLAELGAQALIEALELVAEDFLKPVPQDAAGATYAPKLSRDIARIDWSKDAAAVARLVRGLDPKPGAWTALEGTEIKLFGARATGDAGAPGEILTTDDALRIAAGTGAVEISDVQPAGKPRMTATAWLRGRGARAGQRFA